MTAHGDHQPIVLFAIGREHLQRMLTAAVNQFGLPFPYHHIDSADDARRAVAQQALLCIVMTVDVAYHQAHPPARFIDELSATQPTVTLVERGDGYPDYWYWPNTFHNWCTVPFNLDDLVASIRRVVTRAEQHRTQ